jgi:hypothetical protein
MREIGDFEAQISLLEVLVRIVIGGGSDSVLLFEPELSRMFFAISKSDFEPDARIFINQINKMCGADAKVITFGCVKAEVSIVLSNNNLFIIETIHILLLLNNVFIRLKYCIGFLLFL